MLLKIKERCPVCGGWGYDREGLDSFLSRISHIKGTSEAFRDVYKCSYCNDTGVVKIRKRHRKWKALLGIKNESRKILYRIQII